MVKKCKKSIDKDLTKALQCAISIAIEPDVIPSGRHAWLSGFWPSASLFIASEAGSLEIVPP